MARLFRAVLAFAALTLAGHATAGPVSLMHGFADMASITLWVQTAGPARIAIEFHAEGAPDAARRVETTTRAEDDFAAQLRLANLEPGTAYRYRVSVDGRPADDREGVFRTQPYWQFRSDPPDFSVAFGSCAYLNDRFDRPGRPWGGSTEIFDAIAAKSPDLMLWIGDNVYFRPPEWTSLEGMSSVYRAYRSSPGLRKLLVATSHVAVWDDHDFGPDNSDGSFVGKANALEAFRRYWPNPTFGLPGVPGVFGQITYGDADFFLLDNRFHRYPNRYPDSPGKTMLGDAQLEWLKQALVASRATFKVVVAGGQFWNARSRLEGLHQFPRDRKALADWLAGQRIPGVVFLSGDRHFAELLRVDRPGAYPLYEFTSSPLTAGIFDDRRDEERANPDLVPGTYVNERNFGMLRFGGPRDDRVLAFESYDAAGRLLWRHEVRASSLRAPKVGQ